jgi:hypothetical protein
METARPMQRLNRSQFRAMALIALVLWTAACGSSSAPAAPTPPPTTTTDTLTGTLSPTNANAHTLNAAAAGTMTLTLNSLTPAVPAVGLGIGVVSNGSCSLQFTNSPFSAGSTWTANLGGSGTFCVVIYDIGLLTQDTTYSITVVHP